MKPRLFDKNATQTNTNGLGTLDFISCKITEERNGIFELEGEISEKVLHASQLEMCSIILAQVPDQSSLQQFRVYKVTKPINGIQTIYAQHISYQLSMIPTMPFEVIGDTTACAQSLAGLKSHAVENCPFNFSTDVTTVASFGFQKPISIRNALGGVKGSILDRFGGEYLWDNYTVYLKKNRGRTPQQINVTLRYGKDITDLNQEENISNTVTGVVPFWLNTDGTILATLPEYKVESQYADRYPFKRTIPLDLSQDFENRPSEGELRTSAQAYVNKSGLGVPQVSIKVSFINLDIDTQTQLQKVKLCDVIGVEFEKLQISTTAKVVKYVYDVLKERYISIEVGTIRPSLAQTISDTNGALTTTLDKAINATKGATAWLTGSHGYVMAVKNTDGSWKELLFMDTNDAETAHNVLRINENGIGFSSNGVNGPYTQAWTLDGKMVIGGTNVPSLTVYDNQNTILFQISKDGMIWKSANSEMDILGNLTCIGATIKTSTSGSRIVLDSSSSLKGYYGDDLHNIINMSNRNGVNNDLIIDADHELHIRTPKVYVSNTSYGTGGGTVYETYNNYNDGYSFVSDVYKRQSNEYFLKGVTEDEADVLCMLPVLLTAEWTTFKIRHGMLMSGASTHSENIT